MVDVRVDVPKELLRRLDIRPALQSAAVAVAEAIRNELQKYPPPPAYPLQWSVFSRNWWFAARRAAGLPPKYTRLSDPWSQRLQTSWAVERVGDVGAVVGTTVSYAPFVQSAERQAEMHRATGWVTDEMAVERVGQSGQIEAAYEQALRAHFEAPGG